MCVCFEDTHLLGGMVLKGNQKKNQDFGVRFLKTCLGCEVQLIERAQPQLASPRWDMLHLSAIPSPPSTQIVTGFVKTEVLIHHCHSATTVLRMWLGGRWRYC